MYVYAAFIANLVIIRLFLNKVIDIFSTYYFHNAYENKTHVRLRCICYSENKLYIFIYKN